MEAGSLAVREQSPSHSTAREFPREDFLIGSSMEKRRRHTQSDGDVKMEEAPGCWQPAEGAEARRDSLAGTVSGKRAHEVTPAFFPFLVIPCLRWSPSSLTRD